MRNSPHKSSQVAWPSDWPKLGGGERYSEKLTANELFDRICLWEQANYLMCAGTPGSSNAQSHKGLIDAHGYTILRARKYPGGTDLKLILLRNPWGHKEFENAKWSDHGRGWTEYPEVYDEINPTFDNDGFFWMELNEFAEWFITIELCAMDISEWAQQDKNSSGSRLSIV